jgi:hypothetical protein
VLVTTKLGVFNSAAWVAAPRIPPGATVPGRCVGVAAWAPGKNKGWLNYGMKAAAEGLVAVAAAACGL